MRPAWVVLAVLVVAGAARLWRHRRRAHARPGASRLPSDRPNPFGATGLVAGREIRERLRGRVFRVVTALLFLAIAAIIVIPTLRTTSTPRATVGVVRPSSALEDGLRVLAHRVGLTIRLVDEPSLKAARTALRAGTLDVVVDSTHSILVDKALASTDTSARATFVRELSLGLGAQGAYARAGLTASQVAIIAGAKALPVVSLHPAKKPTTASETTALLGVILNFIVLTQYLTWTLMGVMEEKASRVVEVLLATVRPLQLLSGKVLGIGSVAMAQAAALVVFALLLGRVVGSSFVHGAAPLVAAATLVWLVLGYAFYSWVYAAAGSLGERQDQVQSMALPLSLPLILGYIVSLVGVSSGDPSALVKVLAYLPPTAPFAMVALVGFGQVAWWQFLASVIVSVGSTAVVAVYAARIYRRAVLRTGGRVRLSQLRRTPSATLSASARRPARGPGSPRARGPGRAKGPRRPGPPRPGRASGPRRASRPRHPRARASGRPGRAIGTGTTRS